MHVDGRDSTKGATLEGRAALAQEVRDACMKVGFFYVQNHGIPQTCLDNVLAAMQTYFGFPMEAKMKVQYLERPFITTQDTILIRPFPQLHHKTVTNFKGYSPPLDANIDAANNEKGDFHEGRNMMGRI
ncbi:hypothetical protein BDN67DRAFT_1013642 [Paxillus ammoniavirescens]|nr:hypothetical protein BDN67DRAFT_1013642 [Paxillus ammoniavirescens]